MTSGAIISECGTYRYRLWRQWGDGPSCTFVMLNPSTADAEQDDPTIRRCRKFAEREGCGRLDVVNLFAYRATDPKVMMRADDPVGPLNDWHIVDATKGAGLVIAAWGMAGFFMGRGNYVRWRLGGANWRCFKIVSNGEPIHPLYQSADQPLVRLPAIEDAA